MLRNARFYNKYVSIIKDISIQLNNIKDSIIRELASSGYLLHHNLRKVVWPHYIHPIPTSEVVLPENESMTTS